MKDRPKPVKDQHLTRKKLRRFLEKHHSLKEENEILLHLLAVCPECQAAAEPLLELYENGRLQSEFSSLEVDLEVSRAEAPGLWRLLQDFPFHLRKPVMEKMNGFRSWGLCEYLCHESIRLAAGNAALAEHVADLAVHVSSLLGDHEPAEELWLFQLRAYALAHLGNARRVQGELRSAEEAFARSCEWWKAAESMGDVLGYEVRLLDLEASLRRDQRRLPSALALLRRALELTPLEEKEQICRLLIKQAKTYEEMGKLEKAMSVLRGAESPFSAGEPRLELCVRHNLMDLLSKVGRFQDAEALLPEVTRLSESLGNPLDAVRLLWSRGRIAAGLGQTAEAVRLLEEVRGEFLRRNISYDTALVTLELAALHAWEGHVPEVKALAWETLTILQAQDVPREAVAALGFFVQAAEKEAFTADLANRLIAFLREARHTPGLWFNETLQTDSGGDDEEGSTGVA
ncbi:MAG TPA: hypothetical protein VF173_03350 [Thermoanaerobaculia bacterium]|nr:hypothetical protein [Thermoanaerobaculia bacterium]